MPFVFGTPSCASRTWPLLLKLNEVIWFSTYISALVFCILTQDVFPNFEVILCFVVLCLAWFYEEGEGVILQFWELYPNIKHHLIKTPSFLEKLFGKITHYPCLALRTISEEKIFKPQWISKNIMQISANISEL